jgi:transcriptional regulator with XRE-family HTH domain
VGAIIATLGQRIRHFRESLDISQERLSELTGIPRPAISQMEAGHRKISADELIRLAELFGVSLDVLVDPDREPKVIIEEGRTMSRSGARMRISVPKKNLTKFREVLLYILNQVGAKPNVAETVIYKLLYFIDFDYYEQYEEQMIGARYQKNRHGPTPMEFKAVVDRMIKQGEIRPNPGKFYGRAQKRYTALRRADLTLLSAAEIKVIDAVLTKYSDMTARQLSDLTHNDVPWLTTQDGGIIRYESVFYRTVPYSVRTYSEDI